MCTKYTYNKIRKEKIGKIKIIWAILIITISYN